MRRDKNDLQWQTVKKQVQLRDKNVCRLVRVLTVGEMLILRKNAGPLLTALDPAHYVPVSENPEIMYIPENIVMLNRYSHTCLDNCKNPITGESITKEDTYLWWDRILRGNSCQYKYLQDHGILKE